MVLIFVSRKNGQKPVKIGDLFLSRPVLAICNWAAKVKYFEHVVAQEDEILSPPKYCKCVRLSSCGSLGDGQPE